MATDDMLAVACCCDGRDVQPAIIVTSSKAPTATFLIELETESVSSLVARRTKVDIVAARDDS